MDAADLRAVKLWELSMAEASSDREAVMSEMVGDEVSRVAGRVAGRVEGRIQAKLEGKIQAKVEGKTEAKVSGKIEAKVSGKPRRCQEKSRCQWRFNVEQDRAGCE